MINTASRRIEALVLALGPRRYSKVPRHVGLKTIIRAREAELIEVQGALGPKCLCRLTSKGFRYKRIIEKLPQPAAATAQSHGISIVETLLNSGTDAGLEPTPG